MWDLIVSVPDHCLSFYFGTEVIILLRYSGLCLVVTLKMRSWSQKLTKLYHVQITCTCTFGKDLSITL